MGFRLLTTFAITLFLVGCGSTDVSDAGEARTAPPETLEEARQKWHELNIENYAVTAQMTCFCPQELVQPIRLEVQGGNVVSSEGLKQPLESLAPADAQRLTVDGLFQFVEDAKRREAHTLEVSYDSAYGFPAVINYDGHPMIADDERQYRLSDFTPGTDP